MEIVLANDADFAYPTLTIYIEPDTIKENILQPDK